MPTRNVNLTERYDRFVKKEIATGRYKNASEVVRAALALLEQWQNQQSLKLEALRRAVREGFDEIDQGKGIVIEDREALERFMSAAQKRAASRVRKRRA